LVAGTRYNIGRKPHSKPKPANNLIESKLRLGGAGD
jgi:hypothetical protein